MLAAVAVLGILVVVPVVYCYLDDLAQWARRKWHGAAPAGAGGGAQAVPASRIDDLS